MIDSCKHWYLSVFCLGLIFGSTGSSSADEKPVYSGITGKWRILELHESGSVTKYAKVNSYIEIKKESIFITTDGETFVDCKYSINNTKTSIEMNLIFDKNQRNAGIALVTKSNYLFLCFGDKARPQEKPMRPTYFSSDSDLNAGHRGLVFLKAIKLQE